MTVLESLHGDLAAGTTLKLPGLTVLADEKAREAFAPESLVSNFIVKGERLLLYLRKANADWHAANSGTFYGHDIRQRTDLSVGLIDEKGVFGRMQVMNPGPYKMSRVYQDEADAKKDVQTILQLRKQYQDAIKTANAEEKVATFRQLILIQPPRYPNASLIWDALLEEQSATNDFLNEVIKITPGLDQRGIDLMKGLQSSLARHQARGK